MSKIYHNLSIPKTKMPRRNAKTALWLEDCLSFLAALPVEPIFDLIITSPPYLVGKSYERKMSLPDFLKWQALVFKECLKRLKPNGSICWQTGSYINGNSRSTEIMPLDMLLHPLFVEAGGKLRNRIIWQFGHGLHARHRFSGRHETILWYTISDDYVFNLDAVRVPQKYPGKRYFRGDKLGEYSGNILGKNPSDTWADIPNVKGKHIEKTLHPCQFPIALAERLIKALSDTKGLVFDPFAGVATTGVAAVRNSRRFWGCEIERPYVKIGLQRLAQAQDGNVPVRPLEQPIFNPDDATADLRHRILET